MIMSPSSEEEIKNVKKQQKKRFLLKPNPFLILNQKFHLKIQKQTKSKPSLRETMTTSPTRLQKNLSKKLKED